MATRPSILRLHAIILVAGLALTPISVFAQAKNRYYTPNANGDYQVYSSQVRINPQPETNYYSTPPSTTTYSSTTTRIPAEPRWRARTRETWDSQPINKTAGGALVGLGAAALRGKNLLHGTVVGLAAGTGFSLMDESRYFAVHPLGRRAAKGAIIGIAAASATGAAALLPALGIGAAVGAGFHALKRF